MLCLPEHMGIVKCNIHFCILRNPSLFSSLSTVVGFLTPSGKKYIEREKLEVNHFLALLYLL